MLPVQKTSPLTFRIVGKDLRVADACSSCGMCVKQCPRTNIAMRNNKPQFGWSCAACLRCIYQCPRQALSLKLFKFFPVKGGYDLHKLLAGECDDADAKANPPFLARYLSDPDF